LFDIHVDLDSNLTNYLPSIKKVSIIIATEIYEIDILRVSEIKHLLTHVLKVCDTCGIKS
jgi:hypothetical protein